MKEELNRLLREYTLRLKQFADESADLLPDKIYNKMQDIFVREFENELKLLKKKNDLIISGNARMQNLAMKILRRNCKEERKDIEHVDLLSLLGSFVQQLQNGDTQIFENMGIERDFVESFHEFYRSWKSDREAVVSQVPDVVEVENNAAGESESEDSDIEVASDEEEITSEDIVPDVVEG